MREAPVTLYCLIFITMSYKCHTVQFPNSTNILIPIERLKCCLKIKPKILSNFMASKTLLTVSGSDQPSPIAMPRR